VEGDDVRVGSTHPVGFVGAEVYPTDRDYKRSDDGKKGAEQCQPASAGSGPVKARLLSAKLIVVHNVSEATF
jgi:hypothetical protein